MTKEEAISWLEIAVPIKALTQEEFNKFIEAVNMAIKALEEPCEDCIRKQDEIRKAYDRGIENGLIPKETCEDCISRQVAKKIIFNEFEGWPTDEEVTHLKRLTRQFDELPPVKPQEPKTGHWIESKGHDDRDHFYICSECGRYINLICGAKLSDYPYCHCGAKMESEK